MRALFRNRLVGFLTVALLAVGLTACDTVEIDGAQPTNSISLEQTISSKAGFEGLLTSMYDRLQGFGLYGQQYMLVPDALADNVNLRPGATSNRYPGFVGNTVFNHLGGYGAYFSTINEANNIIEDIGGLSLEASNPQAVRDRIRGEAFFLRGMAYFDLARVYGYTPGEAVDGFDLGVPIRTEPTRSPDAANNIPRAPNTEVFARAAGDLRSAVSLLEGNPNATGGPQRATAAAALGLLSRVELYRKNWTKADSAATAAISLTSAEVVDARSADFEGAWKASTYPGSVFELAMTVGTDGAATNSNQALQSLTDGEKAAFAYEVLPSADVQAIYAANDARQSLFATDGSGNTYLEKYTGTIANFTDRIPVLRLAELYLNRAEARYHQGDEDGARADLNYIRERRELSAITGASGSALLDEILEERRREFLFEGKRFFTLKRYGMDIPKPMRTDPSIAYSGGPESFKILAPIPTGEVQANPAIEQNPGY
jgi:hypothetical protein